MVSCGKSGRERVVGADSGPVAWSPPAAAESKFLSLDRLALRRIGVDHPGEAAQAEAGLHRQRDGVDQLAGGAPDDGGTENAVGASRLSDRLHPHSRGRVDPSDLVCQIED